MNIYNLLTGKISQQELLNYYNSSITYIQLPEYINGFIFTYKGINNIYINEGLSYYKKKKTIIHELAHIELNQLYQIDGLVHCKINKCEDEADKYIKYLLENVNNN